MLGRKGGGRIHGSPAPAAWRSRAAALTWALVGAAACGAMTPLEPSLLEEGFIVDAAQRLLRGERLYSDIVSFTGPLPFELLALLFRLFGEEIAVARWAVIALAGFACASTHAIASRAGAGALAHAAAALVASAPVLLFPLHSTYFYSTLAYDLTLVAAWAAIRGTRSPGWAAAAGVLVASIALCKQTIGGLLALAFLAAIPGCAPKGLRIRASLATAAGGAAVAALTLIAYGARGELGALVRSLVLLPITLEDVYHSGYMNLWPPGEIAPELKGHAHFYVPFTYYMLRGVVLAAPSWPMILVTQILYALPFVALAATAIRRLGGPLPPATWIHAAAVLALTSNLFPRTDWGHLVFALAPSAVQLFLLAPQAPARAPSPRSRRWLGALAVLVLAAGDLYVGRGLWRTAGPPTLGPDVPQRPVSPLLKDPAVPRVIEFLRERAAPGEAIFVARSEPLIYFVTDTRNPTPYGGVIPGMRQQQESAILAGLERVRFVVMSEIDQPVFTFYRDLLPEVQAYLERHFRVPSEFLGERYGWIIVLERASDRGPAAVDLMEIHRHARRWIRDEGGALRPAPKQPPPLATNQNRRPLPLFLGPRGGGIDFEIEVPAGAVFETDVGLERIRGTKQPHTRRTDFSVSIGRAGSFETLASIPVLLDPDEGGAWRPVEVDLSAYAGERVVLRLEVVPRAKLTRRGLAWWGSPRIAIRPGRTSGGQAFAS